MVLGSSDASRVTLVAKDIQMQQQAEMNLFDITECHMVNMSYPKKGVKMVIKFRRKIMSEMMTTYLPSILLMMITFATTLFKPFFFEAALSVNLTTMLVMTNIFISKMEGLPPTSDIKMIDIWLILCQLVPFAQVVLLTAIEYLREEEQDEREEGKTGEDPKVASGSDKKDDVIKVEDEPKPQEALILMNKKPLQTYTIQKLQAIGSFFLIFFKSNDHLFIAEKKLMPLAVFAAFMIYFCTATGFYFD